MGTASVQTCVDVESRRRLAKLLESLITCNLTNFEFQVQAAKLANTNDNAVSAIINEANILYDDLSEYKLEGTHSLTQSGKDAIRKWILFLQTNLPYQGYMAYAKQLSMMDIMNILVVERFADKILPIPKVKKGIDEYVWPFATQEDYIATQNQSPQ